MLSFEEGFIESQQFNQRLLQTIRLLGEYKGKQELFKQQAPQVLGTLRQAAVIQSTESSNRIEGITVPLERIKKLVTEKTTPRDRSEQEIAGYRDVLTTIHTNYNHIPSITRRGSISWDSCCYQLIGSLSSGWDMLHPQKELNKTAIVLDAINNLPQEFSSRELQERCPTVGIDLIRRLLRRERDAGRLECRGRGVEAHWRKQ